MEDLYLYGKIPYGRPRHAAIGLQPFQQQDLSTGTGCINRVLRSKSTWAAQPPQLSDSTF
jgi:hypothetical protein